MVFSFRASMAPWAASSCYFRLLLKALLLYSRDFLNHRDEATRAVALVAQVSPNFLIARAK